MTTMTSDYRFSPAEMAVMLQHVWGPLLPAGETLQADLGVEERALDEARAALRRRQMLLPAPDRSRNETFVSPPLWAVIATATRPTALGVLEVTATGQPSRSLYFTWTARRMVANWVNEQGEHVLQPLADSGAFADLALRACGLEGFAPAGALVVPTNPEDVTRATTVRAVYVAAVNLPEPREQANALAWMVSAGQLWLMRPTPGNADATLIPTEVAEVRAALILSTDKAIAEAQAELDREV